MARTLDKHDQPLIDRITRDLQAAEVEVRAAEFVYLEARRHRWTLIDRAHRLGLSYRTLGRALGLHHTRVHQLHRAGAPALPPKESHD